MSYSIEHLLHINAPINEVFKALSEVENIKQWYTTVVEENADKTKTFKWGEMFLIVKCIEVENEEVRWEFIDSSMPINSLHMSYKLSENEGKTRVRYSYEGFSEMDDSYSNMNFSSAKYLESLRQYCQNGLGEAFGSLNYRS